MEEKKKYAAPAVEKVLNILEIMAAQDRSFTVTEMAACLGISVNSVFRIFAELEEKKYVAKDPTDSSYELTPKLYYLGSSLKRRSSLIKIAEPYMKKICRKTCETTVLTVLNEENQTLVIAQEESHLPIKCLSTEGHAYDTYISAMGKVLLAYQRKEVLADYLKKTEFRKITEHTITEKQLFLEELEQIRKKGVGYDREESFPGLFCIAAPVFSAGGRIEAAIGVQGIKMRMQEQVKEYSEYIVTQAMEMSQALGYYDCLKTEK